MVRTKSSGDEEADDSATKYSGLRMLAVDDEPTFVETYAKYFGDRGFEVDTATNLREFEEKFIMRKAVVCDMCKSTSHRTPACVSACPHDAAWRGALDAEDAPFRNPND